MWFSIHLKWKHLETFTRSKSSFAYVAKKLPRIVRNGWEKTLQASFPKVPVTCRAWRNIFFVAQFLAPRHLKSGVPPRRRGFLGLKHSIQGFFGVWKCGKYFCGRLDLSGGFIANNITANIKQVSVPEKLPGLSRNGFPNFSGVLWNARRGRIVALKTKEEIIRGGEEVFSSTRKRQPGIKN